MEEKEDLPPSPDDFCNYLPWACGQMQVPIAVVVNKIIQNDYIHTASTERSKKKSRIKLTQSAYNVSSDQEKDALLDLSRKTEDTITIAAVYNTYNELIEIKFDNNKKIPRQILQIIRLMMKIYIQLNKIYINRGIDKYTVYEINEILSVSNITELYLENTRMREGNYYILLETENCLRYLSLSKCHINDTVLEEICKKLIHPKPASRTLRGLNFSTNNITDDGAKFLAEVLKSNRKLCYINLADNKITDDSAVAILNALTDFPVSEEDLIATRSRRFRYLKEKNHLIELKIKELKMEALDSKSPKKKPRSAAASLKRGKLEGEPSLKSTLDPNTSLHGVEVDYTKAAAMVESSLGEFDDPYKSSNIVRRDDVTYCLGNNTLLYLNLANNNLSYISLKKLLDVFLHQKQQNRTPRGLVGVTMEGNPLPISCNEMRELEEFVEEDLLLTGKKMSVVKKRPLSKTASR